MFTNRKLLQANIVLEHFTEVDSHRLADSFVDRVINIEFFKREIWRIQNR